jgi:hypothetical protein
MRKLKRPEVAIVDRIYDSVTGRVVNNPPLVSEMRLCISDGTRIHKPNVLTLVSGSNVSNK